MTTPCIHTHIQCEVQYSPDFECFKTMTCVSILTAECVNVVHVAYILAKMQCAISNGNYTARARARDMFSQCYAHCYGGSLTTSKTTHTNKYYF